METTHTKTRQFKSCQATIAETTSPFFNGKFTVFYSYACPQLVEFPDGDVYQFTFEGSRKEGEKTTSRTTSKQKTQYFGNWRDLPKFSLKDFEKLYFDTRLERYY